MEMKIRRVDNSLPMPEYKTDGAVGLDLYARENVSVCPGHAATIPLNVAIQVPPGTFGGLLPRSSTFRKYGLILQNSLGVIDQDFCGDNDEICALVFYPERPYHGPDTAPSIAWIERGERLFQLVIFNVEKPEIVEVESLGNPDRGGFGSTG